MNVSKSHLVIAILIFGVATSAQTKKFVNGSINKKDAAVERLKKNLPVLMKKADVPGLSIALIRDGKMIWNQGFGFTNSTTKEPVNEQTVFEAASLSKPVFAYAVLRLVDEGRLDLDTPLNKYLPGNYDVVEDDRVTKITARNVLTHTTGFPNWRTPFNGKTLKMFFQPGERFSYSGEGFVYLSKVVEQITGMKFDDHVRESLFKPLGMNSSSFAWQDRFKVSKTFNHDLIGNPSGQNETATANAAGSLLTTSADYARFVSAVLNGTGLKKQTRDLMITPQVTVDEACRNCTARPVGTLSKEVAWGLGVGLQTTDEGISFWHWGDNGNTKAFFVAFDKQRDGIVVLTNSANGLLIIQDILADGLDKKYPAVAWINTGRFDSPIHVFLKALIADGPEKAITDFRKQRSASTGIAPDENGINNLGYDLLRVKKFNEAIAVFKMNTEDFPKSANTWDSLAEGYDAIGDKKKAIENYKKSVELNPENRSAAANIKRLEHVPIVH